MKLNTRDEADANSIRPTIPITFFGEQELKVPRRNNKSNNKIESPKLQSIFTRSVPSEHKLQLCGQVWRTRIYFFIFPNGLVKIVFVPVLLPLWTRGSPGQRNESWCGWCGTGVPHTMRVQDGFMVL